MAATAAARRVAASPARRATANRPALKPRPRRVQPARRPARPAARAGTARRPRAGAARRRSQTPIGGFVPVAVGATAGAIGGLADSGLVVRLTRGRWWIGVLGTMLVGIVALNVFALSLNASSSRVAEQTDGLKRANSALQARIAGQLSNEKVQAAADDLGLLIPAPGAIRYLTPGPGDAAAAARRLANGDLTLGTDVASAPVDPAAITTPTAATDAAAPVTETAIATTPVATDTTTTTTPDAGAVTAP